MSDHDIWNEKPPVYHSEAGKRYGTPTEMMKRIDELEMVLKDVIRGVRWWAQQEDGIPDEMWEAYRKAEKLVEPPAPAATDDDSQLLRCPADVESATGTFDPSGYSENDCAGCGMPRDRHVVAPAATAGEETRI